MDAGEEFADFFNNAAIGLHYVSPDGIILKVNQAELDLLGYREEEYVGHPIARFHVDQEVIEELLRRLHAGETILDCEARLRCKDGSIKWVCIDSNVRWLDGKFLHTRCFTRDITRCKSAEEESVRQAETRFRSVVEGSMHGIMVRSGERIEFANSACAAHFRLRQHGRDRGPAVVYPGRSGTLAGASGTSRGVFCGETVPPLPGWQGIRKDGARIWLESSARSFLWDGQATILVFVTDITQRKATEEALRQEQAFVRLVLDTDPNLIFVTDVSGRFVLVNKALADLYGTTPEGLAGPLRAEDVASPRERAAFFRVEQEVLRTGWPIALDEINTRPDGTNVGSTPSRCLSCCPMAPPMC